MRSKKPVDWRTLYLEEYFHCGLWYGYHCDCWQRGEYDAFSGPPQMLRAVDSLALVRHMPSGWHPAHIEALDKIDLHLLHPCGNKQYI